MREHPFELARAIGTALVLSLAGCPGEIQTASPAAELELTDKLETPLALASEYVLIAPRPLPPPSTWRFSPDGQHLAAPLDEGCGVWELESGRHAGVFGAKVGEPTCERWPPVIRDGRPHHAGRSRHWRTGPQSCLLSSLAKLQSPGSGRVTNC